REDQDHQREDEHHQHRHFYVVGFDLLAQILGRSSHHQPGDEHRQHDVNQDAVQAGANAAEDDLAEHDVHQRHHAAERGEGIVPAVDGAATGVGGDRG